MVNSLTELKSDLVSDRIIKRLDENNITLSMIHDMVDTDDYSKLTEIPYISQRIAENIALRYLELYSEQDAKEEIETSNESKTVEKKDTEIKVSVFNTKETILPSLLPKILEKYIKAMMEDNRIPKFMINREHYYPIDYILFGKEDVYIKVSFIRDLFNDYINKSFIINIQDPFKYACVGSSIIHYTTVEGKKYQYHKCDVSGNDDNYIQIYRKMLLNSFGRVIYINQSMDPYNSTSYMPDIDIHSLEKEDDDTVLVYSTVEGKQKNINIVNHSSSKKEDAINSILHVVINSCHPIFGGKFLATFSVLTKVGSKYDFETKVNTGIFNFDKDDIENGTVTIDGFGGSIPDLKRKVISLL